MRETVYLGRGDRHLREAIQLAHRLLLDALRHPGGLDLLRELFDVLGLIVALAELLLDRLELLAQEILALVLANFRLHLRLDLRAELENLQLLDQDAVQAVHARAHVERLEHLLLHRRRDGAQAGGDEIGQPPGFDDVRGECLEVVGQQRRERHDLLKIGLDVPQQRVDLEPILVAGRLGSRTDPSAQVRPRLGDLIERQPRESLHDQPQAAVGQLEHLVDVARGAHPVQVVLLRLFDRGVALGEDTYQLAARDRLVNQADRALAGDRQRHERVGEQHGVPQRKDRELVGQ